MIHYAAMPDGRLVWATAAPPLNERVLTPSLSSEPRVRRSKMLRESKRRQDALQGAVGRLKVGCGTVPYISGKAVNTVPSEVQQAMRGLWPYQARVSVCTLSNRA